MLNDTFVYTNHAGFDSSSFADQVWYNVQSEELVIETLSGSTLQYNGVPYKTYTGLVNSDSAGAYFAQVIKGRYDYVGTVDYAFYVLADSTPDEVTEAPVAVEGVLAESDDQTVGLEDLGKYSVTAYFDSLEDAYTTFSYADGVANYVTLTAEKEVENG